MLHRRLFLQSAAGAAAALAQNQPPAGHLSPPPPNSARPNILWIFGDQFRAQALPLNGDPNSRAPNLSRAEVNGVTFTNHVSGFPLCCPFRGSLLASRYPHHCVPGHEYPLPAGQRTIADVFNENGYHTAYFGKCISAAGTSATGAPPSSSPTRRAAAASRPGLVTP